MSREELAQEVHTEVAMSRAAKEQVLHDLRKLDHTLQHTIRRVVALPEDPHPGPASPVKRRIRWWWEH